MTLSSDLAKIRKNSSAKAQKAAKASLFRVFSASESMSPVDTGVFKGGWFIAFGAPDNTVNDNASRDSIGPLRVKLGSFKMGEVVYFTNNMPYANLLEYGLSDQAPGGMVRLSARRWPDIVADEIRKAK